MAEDLYVITGATGHIGRLVAEKLLKQNKKVRVIGRDANKLKALADKGAEVFVGNVEKADHMTRAFQGVKAVFLLIPPNYISDDFRKYQNRVSEAYEQALKATGVRYVVNLSSIGAHRPDKLGPINGLYDHEQRLNKLAGVHVVHLRPAYFMENHFNSLGLIKQAGINGSAMKGDVAIPQISTSDIAEMVAQYLLKLDFAGQVVHELLGPRDLTLQEATAILGQAIGKPDLKYVQFSYADTEKALTGMGFSKDVARLFNEMAQGMSEGLASPTQGRNSRTTTPTRFEEFAKDLAKAYQN
jgi:uncharacterized protein YbjT (DUF2867 family)